MISLSLPRHRTFPRVSRLLTLGQLFSVSLLTVAFLSSPSSAEEPRPRLSNERGSLRLERSAAPDPTRGGALGTWHRTYRREMEPVEKAYRHLQRTVARTRPAAWRPACRALRESLRRFDHRSLEAPYFSVTLYLQGSLRHLAHGTDDCLAGRFSAVQYHLAETQRGLQQAALVLRPYGLEP